MKRFAFILVTVWSFWPIQACAQRTAENATTQSGDAFGRQVGSERTGLYSPEEVRGFNPVDAGNARIEGLYFDQIDRLPLRITEGSTVRVGISAQRYPFPAPTGLIDYTLTVPGGESEGSFDLDSGPFGGPGGAIEFKLPLVASVLGLAGGIGARHSVRPEGGTNNFLNYGVMLTARPYADATVMMFGGAIANRGEEARPTLFPVGALLPPKMERGQVLSQPWATRNTDNSTYGFIAKLPVAGARVEAGLFQTRRDHATIFADILSGVAADGTVASRTIVADGNNIDQSLSGELRLVREWTSDELTQSLTASLRRRNKQRQFGGSKRIALGVSSILVPDVRTAPNYVLGPKNHDDVDQLTYGVAYSLSWARHGSLDLGLSKTNYRKEVDFADPALVDPVTSDAPLLWNAAAQYQLFPKLMAYLGISRGMEEALVAPDIASNRSEAPPAIRTRQEEAGLRIALTDRLTLVGGVFRIAKPYYNLDPALRYRQLGTISIRGLELSLTGQLAPGLTLVGGTVFMDPRIAGEAVTSGVIGPRPVGQLRRRSVANLDWRSDQGAGAFSFDLAFESFSSRMGNAQNTLSAPPRNTLNIGVRYRFALGGTKMLLRPKIDNLFNNYGWLVSSSGGFTYSPGRSAQIEIAADF